MFEVMQFNGFEIMSYLSASFFAGALIGYSLRENE